MTTGANAPLNHDQRRMLRFGSFDPDGRKCRIRFAFVGTDVGVQVFSRTPTTRSSKMIFRPSWDVLCSWSRIETVPYCLQTDLFEAFLISILDFVFLGMAVGSSNSHGPSGLVHEAGSDPLGHVWVTLGGYLWAGKLPLADIILSHPPDLT